MYFSTRNGMEKINKFQLKQIEWVVMWPVGRIVVAPTERNHTLYDIPPIRFVFQVTQKGLRSSLVMAGYCRNM
jgi:hypothetical protein